VDELHDPRHAGLGVDASLPEGMTTAFLKTADFMRNQPQ